MTGISILKGGTRLCRENHRPWTQIYVGSELRFHGKKRAAELPIIHERLQTVPHEDDGNSGFGIGEGSLWLDDVAL